MITATLGSFVLRLRTVPYNGGNRTTNYRWASSDRTGAPPALQYTGLAEETMDLSCTLFPRQYTGGEEQVEEIKKIANDGKPLPLIVNGKHHGYWVIKSVKTDSSHLQDIDGVAVPRKIALGISLIRYHDAVTQAASTQGAAT